MMVIESQPSSKRLRALRGMRVLIVDDELLVAMETRAAVADHGVKVIGPVPRVRPALEIIENEPLDGAVLDINLRGVTSFEVADALADRNIPFVFMTGYSRGILPPRFKGCVTLSKPLAHAELAAAMLDAFVRRRQSCRG